MVDWLGGGGSIASVFRVFDPYGEEVFEGRDFEDEDLDALKFTGTYTLLVEGRVSNTGLETYELNLVPRASRSIAINVGDTVNETLAIGESVHFTFNAPSDMFAYFDSLTNEGELTW